MVVVVVEFSPRRHISSRRFRYRIFPSNLFHWISSVRFIFESKCVTWIITPTTKKDHRVIGACYARTYGLSSGVRCTRRSSSRFSSQPINRKQLEIAIYFSFCCSCSTDAENRLPAFQWEAACRAQVAVAAAFISVYAQFFQQNDYVEISAAIN